MANPLPAYKDVYCDGCNDCIEEGEDVYFHEGDRFCEGCANEQNIKCECGNYKKQEYAACYSCKFEK